MVRRIFAKALFLLACFGGTTSAIAAPSYDVDVDQTRVINEHGVCKEVTNHNPLSLFVPTLTALEWSSFRLHPPNATLLDCIPVVVSTRTDTETAACPTGYSGQRTRTRLVEVMSDGSERPQSWTSWNEGSCAAAVIQRTYEQEARSCPAGSYGSPVYRRERLLWGNGVVTFGSWVISSGGCNPGTAIAFTIEVPKTTSMLFCMRYSYHAPMNATVAFDVRYDGTFTERLIRAAVRPAEETCKYTGVRRTEYSGGCPAGTIGVVTQSIPVRFDLGRLINGAAVPSYQYCRPR